MSLAVATHTCWNDEARWAGRLAAFGVCAGCDQARRYACDWCGYGHVFPTHNPLAHAEAGDPNVRDEEDFPEWLWAAPYPPTARPYPGTLEHDLWMLRVRVRGLWRRAVLVPVRRARRRTSRP